MSLLRGIKTYSFRECVETTGCGAVRRGNHGVYGMDEMRKDISAPEDTAPDNRNRRKNVIRRRRAQRRIQNRRSLRRKEAALRLKNNGDAGNAPADALEVSAVRAYTGVCSEYALCPRCKMPMEREFLRYCGSCGQRLAWNRFREGLVEVIQCGGEGAPARRDGEAEENIQAPSESAERK